MRLILCNCPPDHADALARMLVERRLAACVNALPGVRSTYRWDGAVCTDDEVTLLIKTRADRVQEVTDAIVAHHPYDVPEVIALPILEGHAPYLSWVIDATSDPDPAA